MKCGEKYGQTCDSLFQLHRLGLPLFWQNTRNLFSAAESKCQTRSRLCLDAATLRLLRTTLHHLLLDIIYSVPMRLPPPPPILKAGLPVCPSVPETLNLWGQSRSQVRSSGTGLHSVSTRQKEKGDFLFGISLPMRFRRRPRRCHLHYHRKRVGRDNVTLTSTACPWRDRDASGWTRRWPPPPPAAHALRGPILLAGFVLSPSPGSNRKTAKGCDPAVHVSSGGVMSSSRWCFCQ